mmetsp:Transcript_62617/g.193912  ORF Transcript_62617/g.193912 Transcript_62617/m.193912 type:complete len:248 (-) Transcript_62617:1418-2161(-)
MYGPYSFPSQILSRVLKMYDSTSFRLSSVSMISRISACIANSSSCSFCTASSPRPGRPDVAMPRSVFLVRRFFFTTSTHSYRFSGALFSGTLTSASFFSVSASPASGSFISWFSLFSLASPSSAILASPSASCSAFSPAGASSSASSGAVPFSSFFSGSPSPSAGSSGSGGSSRFSLTHSSYSSSSSICALSMLKVPCRVSLALTLTFLGSVCGGSSMRNVPSSLGVRGSRTVSSPYSALMSKGLVL